MNNHQYAGFGARLVAAVIDGIILAIISAILGALFDPTGLLSTLVGAAYSIYFWVKQNGQTPGKKAMNIRVVRADGKPMDIMTGVLRYVGYIVSAIPLFLGYIWVLFDAKKQGWHDKIAGTYVIKT